MNHASEFDKKLKAASYRHHPWTVFGDFAEMAALSFVNALEQRKDREERYTKIAEKYERAEWDLMTEMLGVTSMALAEELQDFLGAAFMRNELGSHYAGQFFTPFNLSLSMAEMTLGSGELWEGKRFVTIQEPACGSGGMVLAVAKVAREKELGAFHVTAMDISPVCVHMAVIQLSLADVPAIVLRGDTMALDFDERWVTPSHHMGFWDLHLRWQRKCEEQGLVEEPATVEAPEPGQLELF